ncbi:MAG: hypothetical protein IPI43_31845 [Sandaracinaceae bacterium]|nr:hypothetical protein [Sandaracinaceae bacterium]
MSARRSETSSRSTSCRRCWAKRAAADIDALQGPDEPEEKKPRKKGHGRRPLPEDLPRVDIEIIPDEVQRAGLDAFERIGEEVTEVLERRPGSMVIARIIKPKFVRKDRDRTRPPGARRADAVAPDSAQRRGPASWRTRSCVAGRTTRRCTP